MAAVLPYSANAAISVNNNSPLEEVFLAVWDINGDKTYIQDLGVDGRATNWSTATFSFSVSSALTDLFASSDPANLRYGVYAGLTEPGFASQELRFAGDSSIDVNSILTVDPFTDLAGNLANLDDLTTAHNALTANPVDWAVNAITTAASGQGAIGNNPGSVFNGLLLDGLTPVQAFGTIGQALDWYLLGWDANATDGLNVRDTFLSWSFDGQTLTYGGAPPIPLPAGIWLLGSALLGLVGIARRRPQVALAPQPHQTRRNARYETQNQTGPGRRCSSTAVSQRRVGVPS
ncbi:MAG: VPLPA-CTERM sorting domain-containing protein [Gammaproteobacteria bacterium]|nr:VPLPA-CTERM sorting domain-containing protein [Gammaproteobacteria bacterium]